MRLTTPVWTNPRVKPPFGAVKLNQAHPLARGLAFFCLFRRDEPTGGVDLVRGFAGTVTGSPDRSWRGLRCTTTAYTSWDDAQVGGDTPYIGALTLAWRGVVTTGSGSFDTFVTKHTGPADAGTPFRYFMRTGTNQVASIRAGAGSVFSAWVGGSATVGEPAEFTTTYADNQTATVPLGYKNGVPFTYSNIFGVTPGAVTGESAPLRVGYDPENAFTLIGEVAHVAIWSRALSAAEAASFYAEPYAMLTPVAQPLPTLDIPQGEGARILRSRVRTW